MSVEKMFHHIRTNKDIETVVAVCPYCYGLRKGVTLGADVLCIECNRFFRVGTEIISIRIKVKGLAE